MSNETVNQLFELIHEMAVSRYLSDKEVSAYQSVINSSPFKTNTDVNADSSGTLNIGPTPSQQEVRKKMDAGEMSDDHHHNTAPGIAMYSGGAGFPNSESNMSMNAIMTQFMLQSSQNSEFLRNLAETNARVLALSEKKDAREEKSMQAKTDFMVQMQAIS